MQRIPTLDGWRALAILLVMADHTQFALVSAHPFGYPGGHGVAIFFVLSGYLITSRLRLESEVEGRIDLKRFYIRRFFRLMPVACIYLGSSLSFLLLIHFPFNLIEFAGALFFFRNYLDSPTLSPMTIHFWSLSLEEQFYLVWPPLLFLLGSKRSRYIAAVAATAVAAYRFSHLGALLALPIQATFRTEFRADGLFIGSLAALVLPELPRYFRSWLFWVLLPGFLFCLYEYGFIIPAVESIVIALLIHTTAVNGQTIPGRILDWKPLAYLGTISYSIYVWQQPFLNFPMSGIDSAAVRIAIALAIAALSYHWLERPFIGLGRRLTSKPKKSYPSSLSPVPGPNADQAN